MGRRRRAEGDGGAAITAVRARAFTIPTDAPEADGTLRWDATTLVLVEADAGGHTGLGATYESRAACEIVTSNLAPAVVGLDAFDIGGAFDAMLTQVRNIGSRGVAACAIAAVDQALWDLKARLLGVALANLLGRRREAVPCYGSGGFTSYDEQRLRAQLGGWVEEGGCQWVKMKVGRGDLTDLSRLEAARDAAGEAGLFIDANGAYARNEARDFARAAADYDVTWFEEPVSSDDLAGLRHLRERAPGAMRIAAGEYGYEPFYFRHMLEAGAVDVLQADLTRCLGITGFLRAADLADAWSTPFSCHCAPAFHLAAACAAPRLINQEWFHDHVRIEAMLFEGAPRLKHGAIAPDLSQPGAGLTLKAADAERYAV
ncbi:MAG TPA: enolase C-terminal domain-like protein [Caulobacteraceae bacterium]|nr:enolase C-terminal domain-like protein [Caulobacteraceae bacterium]